MATLTLTRMAEGGVYDQLGGGFFRYSVDRWWMIPHFEKMLYDNGPLLAVTAEAAIATGEDLFRRVAVKTADWAIREMQCRPKAASTRPSTRTPRATRAASTTGRPRKRAACSTSANTPSSRSASGSTAMRTSRATGTCTRSRRWTWWPRPPDSAWTRRRPCWIPPARSSSPHATHASGRGATTTAVNDRRKSSSGEWIDDPVFVDVTFWGRTAEVVAEYLGKGSSVLVEGRLKLDTWEKEGKKHSKLRVVGERMQMLGQRSGSGGRGPGSPPSDEAEYAAAVGGEFSSGSGPRGTVGAGGNGTGGGAEPPSAPSDPDIPF